MKAQSAIDARIARLARELRFTGLDDPGGEPNDEELRAATHAFVDTLYPPQLAGAVVLARDVDPSHADQCVATDPFALGWIRTLDESSSPVHWWHSWRAAAPEESRFVAPTRGDELLLGKPSHSCFYTAGGSHAWRGMWATVAARESPVVGPVFAWKMRVRSAPRELVIDSALAWCELVRAACRETNAGDAVEWARVAELFDCVTVTAKAVAATQGIQFRSGTRTIAPTYWDTRSTVWLRWSFESAIAGS